MSVPRATLRKVAYLSMDAQDLAKYTPHHELLTIEPMRALGWDVDVSVNWHLIKSVNWSDYAAIIIRTTWDYQSTPEEFLSSLRYIRETYPNVPLLNDIEMVEWNLDKRYLNDLSQNYGVPVVPTVWSASLANDHQEGGRKTIRSAIREAFERFPTITEFVVKPCISAGSDFTYRCCRGEGGDGESLRLCASAHRSAPTEVPPRDDQNDSTPSAWLSAEESIKHLEDVYDGPDALCKCHFMVQPFLAAIKQEGEYSVFVFHGNVSHVTQKVPKAGDFRVQEEFGGEQLLRDYNGPECPSELREAVTTLLSSFPRLAELLYGRVDLVRDAENLLNAEGADGGKRFLVAELEIVEPSLYFAFAPGSAERFAVAFNAMMKTL
jgi:hypothetical protein